MGYKAHSSECRWEGWGREGGSEKWSEGDRTGQRDTVGETAENIVKPSGEMETGKDRGEQGARDREKTGTK